MTPSVEQVVGTAVLRRGNGHAHKLKAVMQIVQEAGQIKAHAIAGKLGVSRRTVYSLVDELQWGGAPIVGESGKGYRWHG